MKKNDLKETNKLDNVIFLNTKKDNVKNSEDKVRAKESAFKKVANKVGYGAVAVVLSLRALYLAATIDKK